MGLEKTLFIWVVTFLIGIGTLSYRNFYSEEIRTKIDKREKVGTISLTVITLGLPFILGKLTMTIDLLEAISKLSSIGTLAIVYISWRAYKDIFQAKASEVVFNKVASLIGELQKIRVVVNKEQNRDDWIYGDWDDWIHGYWDDWTGNLDHLGLFEFWEEYYSNNKETPNILGLKMDDNEFIKENLENEKVKKISSINRGRIKWLEREKLRRYYYDPLVPKSIRKPLIQIQDSIKVNRKLSGNENYKCIFETVEAINEWFEQKGLRDYTF